MINHRHITVIIPALDEEESISRVIHDIPDCVDQILVVDNASQDATAVRAEQAGARVVHEPQKGYGKACLTGILMSGDTDILAFIDGDYSDYPEDLVKLFETGGVIIIVIFQSVADRRMAAHRVACSGTRGGERKWPAGSSGFFTAFATRILGRCGAWAKAHWQNCKWEMKGSAGRQRCN